MSSFSPCSCPELSERRRVPLSEMGLAVGTALSFGARGFVVQPRCQCGGQSIGMCA